MIPKDIDVPPALGQTKITVNTTFLRFSHNKDLYLNSKLSNLVLLLVLQSLHGGISQ